MFAIAAVALAVQGSLELRGPLFAFLAFNLAVYSLAAYGERRLAVRGVAVWAGLLTVRLGYVIVTRWPQVTMTGLRDVVDDYVAGRRLDPGRGCPAAAGARRRAGGPPPGWSGSGRKRPGRR